MNEAEAQSAAERAVARIVGRPLGLVAAVSGAGLAIAALGRGEAVFAAGWALVGLWGLAAWSVAREAAARGRPEARRRQSPKRSRSSSGRAAST